MGYDTSSYYVKLDGILQTIDTVTAKELAQAAIPSGSKVNLIAQEVSGTPYFVVETVDGRRYRLQVFHDFGGHYVMDVVHTF